jgi:hypothetical protein
MDLMQCSDCPNLLSGYLPSVVGGTILLLLGLIAGRLTGKIRIARWPLLVLAGGCYLLVSEAVRRYGIWWPGTATGPEPADRLVISRPADACLLLAWYSTSFTLACGSGYLQAKIMQRWVARSGA